MSEVTHFTEPVHPDAIGTVKVNVAGQRQFQPTWPEVGPLDFIRTREAAPAAGSPLEDMRWAYEFLRPPRWPR